MVISEVIKKLQEIKEEHGDLYVCHRGYYGLTDSSFHIIDSDDFYVLEIRNIYD